MSNTANFNFKKYPKSEFFNIIHQNDNWDLADSVLKELSENQEIESHIIAQMPHEFLDGETKYRYGWRVNAGNLEFIYEEVV